MYLIIDCLLALVSYSTFQPMGALRNHLLTYLLTYIHTHTLVAHTPNWPVYNVCIINYVVSPAEIERLSTRFRKLDLDNSGAISVHEFKTVLPELLHNPLLPRVISIFDTDGNVELDFQGSCTLL